MDDDAEFSSYEAFEKAYMPKRHADKVPSEWGPEDIGAELARRSLADVRDAVARGMGGPARRGTSHS